MGPQLDIPAEANKIDPDLLAMARTRLGQDAALDDPMRRGAGAVRAHGTDYADSPLSAEGAFAKTAAAAEAVTKRAEQAAQSFGRFQDDLSRREQAMRGQQQAQQQKGACARNARKTARGQG